MTEQRPRQYFRLRARFCQHCCEIIGRWAAFIGVVNCRWCSNRMTMGWRPHNQCGADCFHRHGMELSK